MGAVMVVVALAMLGELRHQVPEPDRQRPAELPGQPDRRPRGHRRGAATPSPISAAKRRTGSAPGRRAKRTAAPRQRPARAAGIGPARLGAAPEFVGNQHWFNTPGGRPLTLRGLRGRVVLVDFWTYSCINCLRTLPYLTAWDARYRKDGLTIVGVHSPEFPFEKDAGNVAATRSSATASATPSSRTTTSRPGTPGATSTGRPSTSSTPGARCASPTSARATYSEKEQVIRELLAEAGHRSAGAESRRHGIAPSARVTTPETYLGAARAERFTNPSSRRVPHDFGAPAAPPAERIRLPRPLADHARFGDRRGGALARAQLRRPPRLPGARLPGTARRRMEVLLDGRPISTPSPAATCTAASSRSPRSGSTTWSTCPGRAPRLDPRAGTGSRPATRSPSASTARRRI